MSWESRQWKGSIFDKEYAFNTGNGRRIPLVADLQHFNCDLDLCFIQYNSSYIWSFARTA